MTSQELLAALVAAQNERNQRFDALSTEVREALAKLDAGPSKKVMEEAVQSLAAYHYELQGQQAETLDLVEDLVASDSPGDRPAGEDVPRLAPAPSPLTPKQKLKKLAKKVVKGGLRLTLGTARRLWDAARPQPSWADTVELIAGPEATAWPRLLVIPTADVSSAVCEGVRRQLNAVDVFLEPVNGVLPDLPTPQDFEYVWVLTAACTDLPKTFVETGRLLATAEPLPFLRFDLPASETRARAPIFWMERDLWRGAEHPNEGLLEHRARQDSEAVLGKTVGLPDDHPQVPASPLGSNNLGSNNLGSSSYVLRRAGSYFVPIRREPRILHHAVEPLAGLARAAVEAPTLLLVTEPLFDGIERQVEENIRQANVNDGRAPLLVSTAPWHEVSENRRRGFEPLVAASYSLCDVFAPATWGDVLVHLALSHRVERVVRIGEALPQAAALSEKIGSLKISVADKPTSAVLPLDVGLEERAAKLRDKLGVQTEDVLVVMAGDLTATRRPETFVAVASLLKEHCRFLLAGDGPRRPAVADLQRLLGLENLLAPSDPDVRETLAAADIVATTAESEPLADVVLTALELGRPVVASAVDDLTAIVGDQGRLIEDPGNVEAFAEAIFEIAMQVSAKKVSAKKVEKAE